MQRNIMGCNRHQSACIRNELMLHWGVLRQHIKAYPFIEPWPNRARQKERKLKELSHTCKRRDAAMKRAFQMRGDKSVDHGLFILTSCHHSIRGSTRERNKIFTTLYIHSRFIRPFDRRKECTSLFVRSQCATKTNFLVYLNVLFVVCLLDGSLQHRFHGGLLSCPLRTAQLKALLRRGVEITDVTRFCLSGQHCSYGSIARVPLWERRYSYNDCFSLVQ